MNSKENAALEALLWEETKNGEFNNIQFNFRLEFQIINSFGSVFFPRLESSPGPLHFTVEKFFPFSSVITHLY